MNSNVVGLIYTTLLIGFCGGVAVLIKKRRPLTEFRREIARKFVHIGVSNWFFIYREFFTSEAWAFGILAFMAVVNYFVELKTGSRRSWGTVYFPISIMLMLFLKDSGFGSMDCLGAGLLGMGYADGFSAPIGMMLGKREFPFNKKKTVAGSACMFAVTLLVVLLFRCVPVWGAVLVAIVATVAEAYTPFGLDNISVPLAIYALCAVLG